MSRPRTYTRTVLFAETFDFPTPPTWDRQSILEARRTVSLSYSPAPVTSPALTRDSFPTEPADLWQTGQHDGVAQHTRPITPLRLQPKSPPRRPATMLYLENKPLPAHPQLTKPSDMMIPEEPTCRDMRSWSTGRQHRRQLSSEFDEEDQPQQPVQPQPQWSWHAPSPECPCCSSHFTSRWSIGSDESRPPSPNSSIHQRLRKMASSSTLRSVRSSIRLRLKSGILQMTRRH
ncbi:hypothetical protein MAPG_08171 [Magnaporthiopsis poae ATCC 64411]|uniref:Uncharacterized protein n=1 Tax=Magnaporthiopsis poae (strain ATCC 64411 / 73-15) TaxID=644358 RepID=A0A0C4E6M7_MAGP6|nr:hypothetical protein MAPG_08171 [Magnaporthiopsis poae ATCC 64411]